MAFTRRVVLFEHGVPTQTPHLAVQRSPNITGTPRAICSLTLSVFLASKAAQPRILYLPARSSSAVVGTRPHQPPSNANSSMGSAPTSRSILSVDETLVPEAQH